MYSLCDVSTSSWLSTWWAHGLHIMALIIIKTTHFGLYSKILINLTLTFFFRTYNFFCQNQNQNPWRQCIWRGGGDHLNNFFLSESNSKPLAHPHDQCCSINCTSYYCAPLSLTKAFSLIQDAVDRHQTHQTCNRKDRSQLNLELNHLALFRVDCLQLKYCQNRAQKW